MNSSQNPQHQMIDAWAHLKLWRKCIEAHLNRLLLSGRLSEKDTEWIRSRHRLFLKLVSPDAAPAESDNALPCSASDFRQFLRHEAPVDVSYDVVLLWSMLSIACRHAPELRARLLSQSMAPDLSRALDYVREAMRNLQTCTRILCRAYPDLRDVFDRISQNLAKAESELGNKQQSSEIETLMSDGAWLFEINTPVLSPAMPSVIRYLMELSNDGVKLGASNLTELASILRELPDLMSAPPLFNAIQKLGVCLAIATPNRTDMYPRMLSRLFTIWLEHARGVERDEWHCAAIGSVYNYLRNDDAHGISVKHADVYLQILKQLYELDSGRIRPALQFNGRGLPVPVLCPDEFKIDPRADVQRLRIHLNFTKSDTPAARSVGLAVEIALPRARHDVAAEHWNFLLQFKHQPVATEYIRCCQYACSKGELPTPSDWFQRHCDPNEQYGINELCKRTLNGEISADDFHKICKLCRWIVFPNIGRDGRILIPADSDLRFYRSVQRRPTDDFSIENDAISDVTFALSAAKASLTVVKAAPREFRNAVQAFERLSDPRKARELLLCLLNPERQSEHVKCVETLCRLINHDCDHQDTAVLDNMLESLRLVCRTLTPPLVIHPKKFRYGDSIKYTDLGHGNTEIEFKYDRRRERKEISAVDRLVPTTENDAQPNVRITVSAGPETENFDLALQWVQKLPDEFGIDELAKRINMLPEKETTEDASRGHDTYLEIFHLLWPHNFSADQVNTFGRHDELRLLRAWFETAVSSRELFRVKKADVGTPLNPPEWTKGEHWRPAGGGDHGRVSCMMRPYLEQYRTRRPREVAIFYVE
jgi:hypothetical protein